MSLAIINTTVRPDGFVTLDYHLDDPDHFQHILCKINGVTNCMKQPNSRGTFRLQCLTGRTSHIRLIAHGVSVFDELAEVSIDIPLSGIAGRSADLIITDEVNTMFATKTEPMRRKARFASIGLHNPKTPENIGGVMRAADAFGAASVAISGHRIDGRHIDHATNTTNAHKKLPVYRGDLAGLIPFGAVPVAVELTDDAVPLFDFKHPKRAFYIFGPEDGSVPGHVRDWCRYVVQIPGLSSCLNLAATVNVVLYDRLMKEALR